MEPRERTNPDDQPHEIDERAEDLIPEDEDFEPDDDDDSLGRPVQLRP